jgi:hypothetical protein
MNYNEIFDDNPASADADVNTDNKDHQERLRGRSDRRSGRRAGCQSPPSHPGRPFSTRKSS